MSLSLSLPLYRSDVCVCVQVPPKRAHSVDTSVAALALELNEDP